ncbi:MAG TPA: efflux transporter outer membrane subunit [Sphingomonas sp.]
MIRTITALTVIASLTACSMAPPYVRPTAPVPQSWPIGDAYLRSSETALPAVRYQDIFRDPRLQALIGQALSNNRDLRVAAANIAAARAQFHIQRAELFPEVDAGAGATFRGGQGATGAKSSFDANVGINAFEVDLFGRIRSESDRALNSYFATEAAARATRLTLIGDIADAWLTYASDKSLLKLAQDTAASAQISVDLTQKRLSGGIAPRTDLRQAQLTLEAAKADVAQLTTSLAQDVNALQLLVGAPVDPANLPNSIDEAGATLAELPAGLDSSILLRRPDVVQAEYQLRAANAEIGAARAALFPKITLTGLIGFASNALGALFAGGAFNWQAGGAATYPIFRAGAGKANVEVTEAQKDAAVATYEKTIQTAFREVSDALARRGTITDQLAATRAQEEAAADNYKLSDMRYRGGIDSYLDSLVAQRSLYAAEQGLINTQLVRASNLVTLYRVLGGDSLAEATKDGPKPLADGARNS